MYELNATIYNIFDGIWYVNDAVANDNRTSFVSSLEWLWQLSKQIYGWHPVRSIWCSVSYRPVLDFIIIISHKTQCMRLFHITQVRWCRHFIELNVNANRKKKRKFRFQFWSYCELKIRNCVSCVEKSRFSFAGNYGHKFTNLFKDE